MSDWLDLELSHQLAPAEAPDQLWERVNAAAMNAWVEPRRHFSARRFLWMPVAAILTIVMSAGAMWMLAKGEEPTLHLPELAALALDAREPLDLHSSDPQEVNEWARREAGVRISLPSSAATCLTGGRIIDRNGQRVAAISYRVDGRRASLLVAHASKFTAARHGGAVWQTGGQSYALAISEGRLESACRICHSNL